MTVDSPALGADLDHPAGPDGARRADFGDLFDADLVPVIRRLGERRRGDPRLADEESASARLAVWQGLAGLGAIDLALPHRGGGLRAIAPVAELMGTALYQSPFFDTITAADLLASTGPHRADGLVERIVSGEVTVAVAAREHATADPMRPGRIDIARERLSGIRRFVAFAPDVDYLLVVGRVAGDREAGIAALVVPAGQPGVTFSRHDDIGRGDFFAVRFTDAAFLAVQQAGGRSDEAACSDTPWRLALARARLRHACYLAGVCRGAIDLTADYARERQVFGQQLAKFQAPAFRLAALASRLEAVRALAYLACEDADEGEDIALAACQAVLLASELAADASSEAIQLHGSYGLTDDCDAQLFYRRAAVDSVLYGTAWQLRREAADLLARRGQASGHRGEEYTRGQA